MNKKNYELKIDELPVYLDSTDVLLLMENVLDDLIDSINSQFADRVFEIRSKIKIVEVKIKKRV